MTRLEILQNELDRLNVEILTDTGFVLRNKLKRISVITNTLVRETGFNNSGVKGDKGEQGLKGDKGDKGDKGVDGNTLYADGGLTVITSPRTLSVSDGRYITVYAPVTLPSASTCQGRLFSINARGQGVTISSYYDLMGNVSVTVPYGKTITLLSDGTNWSQVY